MERDSVAERKLRWSVTESKSAIDSERNGDMERETKCEEGTQRVGEGGGAVGAE